MKRLRPLNAPRPVRVQTDREGRPIRVHLRRGTYGVATVREEWRIDDEWWRTPISRRYVELVLDDGRSLTLYHDLLGNQWYAQGG